jgi:hypothetical protein
MSSYTISKQDYIKAAGLVAGLAEALELWIYDYEDGNNSTEASYYREFERCYTMNALSVKEQYHGDEVGAPSTDSNDYMKDFEKMQKIGKSAGYTRQGLKELVAELQMFFDSAIYQTEKYEYMFKMEFYFNKILNALYKKTFLYNNREAESWGHIEIDHIKTSTATRIM